MNAGAIFLYGESYIYLPNLTSPKVSSFTLFNILNKNNSQFIPKWDVIQEPIPIKSSEETISILNNFEKEIHLNKSNVAFIYLSGHGYSVIDGDIFLLSQSSKFSDTETGLSITRILSILCKRPKGHIVICLELCRTTQGKNPVKEKFINEIKKYSTLFSSLIIIASTSDGESTYGGVRGGISPFTKGLTKMFSEEYIKTPILNFENILKNILKEEYKTNKLMYSDPDFIPIPKKDYRNIFGFYITQSKSEKIEVLSIGSFVERIIERERKSFKSDPFISDVSETLPLKVNIQNNEFSIEELIIGNNNPIIITGQSGSGKTTTAKRSAYIVANEYNSGIINKTAIYFNAGYLNNFTTSTIDALEIILKYIEIGRYFFQIDKNQKDTFCTKYNIVLLIDGIEDLQDKNCLFSFLNQLQQKYGINYIVFCQPYDKPWIVEGINTKFLQEGEIAPIDSKSIIKLDEELYKSIGFKLENNLTPLDLQLLKRYSENNSEIKSFRDALEYEYEKITNTIYKVLDLVIKLNQDQQDFLFDNIVKLYKSFSYELRVNGSFQFFNKNIGKTIYNELLPESCIGLLGYDDFIEVGIRANILSEHENILRFSHRSIQELFIAYSWIDGKIEDHFLIEKCKSTIWESTIATYSVLVDKKFFPFDVINSINPHLIIDCINRGYKTSKTQLNLVIESLLLSSSHWTRNESSLGLTKLPDSIVGQLINLFKREKDFDKRTSIAIALGNSTNEQNFNFLINEYETLLSAKEDEKSNYLRRRILDVLKDRFDFSKVNHWVSINSKLNVKEWARILRSVKIRSQMEIENINEIINRFFRDKELFLLETILEYKRFLILDPKHHSWETKKVILSGNLIKLLNLNEEERLYRCIPALIIEELELVLLVDSLLNALKKEKDIYAIGEISYVVGKIGKQKDLDRLILMISNFIKSKSFSMIDIQAQEGFFNDLKIGILEAMKRDELNFGLLDNNLPPQLNDTLNNARSIQKELRSNL